MRNSRTYYSNTINIFLQAKKQTILGELALNNQFDLTDLQRNSWEYEIEILQKQLVNFSGRILFEYTIPRMGKRVDVVLLIDNIVFLLEFKIGAAQYSMSSYDQVYDYALDLKNFHKESHNKVIIPIVVATRAEKHKNNYVFDKDNIMLPLRSNGDDIASIINDVTSKLTTEQFDYYAWENSIYMPTPTIIEAAQALYAKHEVQEITRTDSDAQNLTVTKDEVNRIIEKSCQNKEKSIIFITGVPGAGKTLVGLDIASSRQDFDKDQRAVFLSGNGPLVEVLTAALTRDEIAREKLHGNRIKKEDAERNAKSIIQLIHRYRDYYVGNDNLPAERIAIFDESQRAWTREQIRIFMSKKKGYNDFNYSEPEFLISTMDRYPDWAVIICLVGGGQEINKGEAGLPEWFYSLKRSFPHWKVYVSDKIDDSEYLRDQSQEALFSGLDVKISSDLHLATSMRSFRSEKLAKLVKALLDLDEEGARSTYQQIKGKYPIKITRNLDLAKQWVREVARGSERFGLIASSGALRLKPEGIFVQGGITPSYWFLNDKNDVRSSYYLEDVASEFDIQGLELDYTIIGWDADFRYNSKGWEYLNFSGTQWKNIANQENRLYLKNAYRVLLTRARQGMVLFIPEGNNKDHTRLCQYYDCTYNYLKRIGFDVLE